MQYLTIGQVAELHRGLLEATGGAAGVRDLRALESAVAQHKAVFEGRDPHGTLVARAAALRSSLVQHQPFVDGNKRLAHAAMETFLLLNGAEIDASVDDQERLLLGLADGQVSRDDLVAWLSAHVRFRT
jgi:death-on-curing protein